MTKFLLLITFIPTLLFAQAQEFAPIGAIWHYSQRTINPQLTSFKTFESLSDTTIDGVDCKKIIEVERYIDTTNVFYHFMYSKNDSVFFYADDDFQLLYDLGANAGDTIVLDYFNTYYDTPLEMIIDSTGTIMINGQERKIQYITSGDGITIEFGNSVIEGIGNTYFMFPTGELNMNGPLRCYQDDSIGLFYNPFNLDPDWNHEDCGEIITGVAEAENKVRISIFPNPAKDFFTINSSVAGGATRFTIYSITGQLVYSGAIGNQSIEVSTTDFSSGLYLVHIITEDGEIHKKIVLE